MASASFRDSMNSLGWSRRDPDVPVTTSQNTPILSKLQSFNPFGGSGSVRLPTHEGPGAPLPAPTRREEEEAWFACKTSIYHSLFCSPLSSRVLVPKRQINFRLSAAQYAASSDGCVNLQQVPASSIRRRLASQCRSRRTPHSSPHKLTACLTLQ